MRNFDPKDVEKLFSLLHDRGLSIDNVIQAIERGKVEAVVPKPKNKSALAVSLMLSGGLSASAAAKVVGITNVAVYISREYKELRRKQIAKRLADAEVAYSKTGSLRSREKASAAFLQQDPGDIILLRHTKLVMLPAANGISYEDYRAADWRDDDLLESGFAKIVSDDEGIDLPVAKEWSHQ